MKNWKYVCPFLIFLLISGCTAQKQVKRTLSNHQEIGESVEDIDYGDNYNIYIAYPKSDIKELDVKVKQQIDQFRNQFLNQIKSYQEIEKAELNINYQSYIKDDRYISIKLDVFQNIHDTSETVRTICYDMKNQVYVNLEDVFHSDALELIANKTEAYFKKEFPDECNTKDFLMYSAPSPKNYESFVLRKDSIVFYFQEKTLFDKGVYYEMKYEDLKEVSTMESEDRSVFVPYDDILNEPVKRLDPDKAMIALTFDDGPTREYTTAILDTLKEYQASATFFVLGSRASLFPDILQRMVLEGNEIGNHTFSHKQLTTLSKERIEEEIAHAQESIHDVTNKYPEMIRPPYGSKNDMVLKCAEDKKIVTWSIDSEDWKSRDAETIVKRVLADVKDGDIILLHDLYEASAAATMILIPELQERGFQLVSVSDLYAYGKNTAGKII